MSKALITIVIPTYRRFDMLQELMAVVCRQLGEVTPDVEVIVVDNCADQSAIEIVTTFATQSPAVQYLSQPVSGVVHARNAGVGASEGEFILFLDDDEVPCDGWLAAFVAMAEQGVKLGFGQIVPRYAAPPEPGLESMISALFSRQYDEHAGADISKAHAELGTGNALFHRATCLPEDAPFDVRFNRSGGEDIWLIKSLMEKGIPLTWVPDGKVEELVPADRMTAEYLQSRRYAQGQLRCQFLANAGGLKSQFQLCKWMMIGAAQVVLHGISYGVARVTNHASKDKSLAQMYGGLGKLLWWRDAQTSFYAKAAE